MSAALLDNPVLAALNHGQHEGQHELGRCSGRAALYDPGISPLAGVSEPSPAALAELAQLVPKGSAVGVICIEDQLPELPEWQSLGVMCLHQMVCEEPSAEAEKFDDLRASDVADMVELAQVTDPGPFLERTIEMGRYIGVRVNGRLVAMAGERMKPPGWVEISAVCTHPDGRGHGYASRLVAALLNDCFATHQRAFLHVREGSGSEAKATAIYERLGFRHRRDMFGHFLQRRCTNP